jgi:hypothetical protein
MSNKLISTRYPFLPLSIHVRVTPRKHIELDTQALIDTGFSGDIVVPATGELKQSLPDAYVTWTMADGSEVMAPIFLGPSRGTLRNGSHRANDGVSTTRPNLPRAYTRRRNVKMPMMSSASAISSQRAISARRMACVTLLHPSSLADHAWP